MAINSLEYLNFATKVPKIKHLTDSSQPTTNATTLISLLLNRRPTLQKLLFTYYLLHICFRVLEHYFPLVSINIVTKNRSSTTRFYTLRIYC